MTDQTQEETIRAKLDEVQLADRGLTEESAPLRRRVADQRTAAAEFGDVYTDKVFIDGRRCCQAGYEAFPEPCPWHGKPEDVKTLDELPVFPSGRQSMTAELRSLINGAVDERDRYKDLLQMSRKEAQLWRRLCWVGLVVILAQAIIFVALVGGFG